MDNITICVSQLTRVRLHEVCYTMESYLWNEVMDCHDKDHWVEQEELDPTPETCCANFSLVG